MLVGNSVFDQEVLAPSDTTRDLVSGSTVSFDKELSRSVDWS